MERNATFPLFVGNHTYSNTSCSRDNVLKTVVFPVLYSFLFLVGLLLNAVAVWVFFRIPSRSHFIIYLKNIVVADVIMTFTFPFKVWSNFHNLHVFKYTHETQRANVFIWSKIMQKVNYKCRVKLNSKASVNYIITNIYNQITDF